MSFNYIGRYDLKMFLNIFTIQFMGVVFKET